MKAEAPQALARPPETSDRAALAQLPCVTVAGQELRLFNESPPLIAALVQDIGAARRRVWIESYIFLDDPAGRAVARALEERARAGLDVRVLYDAIGSQSTSAAFFRRLAEAGVQVHAYHTIREALYRFSPLRILNRRDHRKLAVVDDVIAYFGGMNLVDQGSIVAADRAEAVPMSAGWRDVHVRLAGPRQAEVADSFERSWRRAHGQRIARRNRRYRGAQLAAGDESIQFFDSGPGKKHTRAARVFGRLVQNARRKLRLSMAYFVPVGPILGRLLRARRRGVRIELVIPGASDVPIVQRATRHLYPRLLRRRFDIYERQAQMLHSKAMTVDDEWSVVGSCNLDARSLYINLEFLAVIHSKPFASALNAVIDGEIHQSRRVSMAEIESRSWPQRLLDRFAWEGRWWL
jgi:cardiolipin synthase A/B